jgi:hypothetical protein
MITQKVRILNNTSTLVRFRAQNIFAELSLYQVTVYPAWIYDFNSFGIIEWLFCTPTVTGTYTYYFTEGGSPPENDACLIIEVVDSLTESLETCSNKSPITLIWITREGGRATYIFDQRKDFGGDIGDSKTYDNNGTIKYISRGKNFTTKTVYKTGITNNEVDLLESLRYSIQAWEYNDTTDTCIPIILDSKSYDLYAPKGELNQVTLSYRIATYKTIQSQ